MRRICENRENYASRKFGMLYSTYCVAWQNVKFYHNASLSGLAKRVFLAKHSHHTMHVHVCTPTDKIDEVRVMPTVMALTYHDGTYIP